MNCLSHYYIGGKVFDSVSKDFLRKKIFQSGNAYPDIDIQLGNASHYVDNCMNMIQKLSVSLLNDITDRYVSKSELSFRLGTIMHFVADYYTFVHDKNRFKGSLLQHTIIETKMDAKMRLMKNFELDIDFVVTEDINELYFNLIELKKDFDTVDFSNEINIKYIYAACKGFLTSMVLITEKQYEMSRVRSLASENI
jgi:hypothetical protein